MKLQFKEISDYVDSHREEAIDFLQNYLRIPSPTGKEAEVAQFIKDKLVDSGFEVHFEEAVKNRPNLLSNWKNGEGKTLLLNGHLDVFPPEDNPSRDPWSGEIVGDRIYARGATDMKTGNAAGILAMIFLKRMGFKPKGTISLALNCDEEQGGRYGILHCIEKGLLKADFTICMEASEDTIIVDTDGRIAWKVSITTDGWHAGTRLEGKEDALQMAMKICHAVQQYDKQLFNERYFESESSGAVISVTSISAGFEGKTVNMHPAMCTLWVDRRYTKGETIESAEKEFRHLLEGIEGLKDHYQLETLFAGPRLVIDPNDADIVACMETYEKVFGSKIRPGRRSGAGDAAKLAVAYNQKVPQFGPGIYAVLGSDDEHVLLSQFIGFIKVYMQFANQYFYR